MSSDCPIVEWGGDLAIESFPFVVGRHPECTCHVRDPLVSRYHCSFFLQNDQVWVQDMNSRNGTFVNGRLALLPHVLRDGDQLQVASLEFRVELRPEEADLPTTLVRNGQKAEAGVA